MSEQHIKVLFFAKLREQLNCKQLDIALSEAADVTALIAKLASQGGPWADVFNNGDTNSKRSPLLVAVNQSMTSVDHVLQAGDEVAFFPPVTGG